MCKIKTRMKMMKNNTEKLKMAGIMKNTIEKLNKKNKILKKQRFFLFFLEAFDFIKRFF